MHKTLKSSLFLVISPFPSKWRPYIIPCNLILAYLWWIYICSSPCSDWEILFRPNRYPLLKYYQTCMHFLIFSKKICKTFASGSLINTSFRPFLEIPKAPEIYTRAKFRRPGWLARYTWIKSLDTRIFILLVVYHL